MPSTTNLYNLYLIHVSKERHSGLEGLIHKVFNGKEKAFAYALDYIANRLPSMDTDPSEPEILELAFGSVFGEYQRLSLCRAMQNDENALRDFLLSLPLNTQEMVIDKAFEFFDDEDVVAECTIEPLIIEQNDVSTQH